MRTRTRIHFTLVILFVLFTTTVCSSRPSEPDGQTTPAGPLTASLAEISGLVQVLKPSDGFFKDAFNGQHIQVKDQVLTHEDSRVRINLSNGTMFRVGPFSTFVLLDLEEQDLGAFARLKLEIGRLWIILQGGAVDVETPTGLASVSGSYLFVEVLPNLPDVPEDDETFITCLEGECILENDSGKVVIGAGETATIKNESSAPEKGGMTHKDVKDWTDNNPEATRVVVPLTKTPTPGNDLPTEPPGDTTPTSTYTATMTYTPGPPTNTFTPAPTDANCGPPGDWVIYSVKAGDTLLGLSQLFRVSESDIQYANCMGNSTTITAGMSLFMPNVATSTPTKTPTKTLTPTATKTPQPTNTKTPVPTNTAVPPTATNTDAPTDTNAVFFNISRPPDPITQCLNYYKTDVIDPDGITAVRLYYIVDDSGTEPASGSYVTMNASGGNSYEKANFKISTMNEIGADVVYYRFMVKDSLENDQFYPATSSSPYQYTDNMDCGTNSPSVFTSPIGPNGLTLELPGECTNTYMIDVNDNEGVIEVQLAFSIDGGSNYDYLTMNPFAVDGSGNGTYELDTSIDTTSQTPPVTVFYKFRAQDGLSIWTTGSTVYSFTDNTGCGP